MLLKKVYSGFRESHLAWSEILKVAKDRSRWRDTVKALCVSLRGIERTDYNIYDFYFKLRDSANRRLADTKSLAGPSCAKAG